jgi:hypothetical protein
MALFMVTDDRNAAPHRYVRLVAVDAAELPDQLAQRIRTTYLNLDTELQRLHDAANELGLFDPTGLAPDQVAVNEALEELADALLPAPWDGRRLKHTDVQRSELAEIIASDALSENFDVMIPASRVADKEIPDQQSRGADVVGFEALGAFLNDPAAEIILVLAEVKGSVDAASPPEVVSGMEAKLRELTSDRRAILQELTWVRDHASDETVDACSRVHAAFLLKRLNHQIRLAPVLVRSAAYEGAQDAGNFEADPGSFAPHPIRFHSVIVDDDLFKLAAQAYMKARAI